MKRFFSFCAVLLALAAPAWAGEAKPGVNSGLPVPRFVSIAPDKVNVRAGPGNQYPIAWVYVKKNYPVEIVAEFDLWRKIRDIDGATGWVHKSMTSGRRYGIIQGGLQTLLEKPRADADPIANVEKGVLARILECRDDWCKLRVEGEEGWLKRGALWGVYPNEAFD